MVHRMANRRTDMNPLFFKIAIMMGASLGISQISLASSLYFDNEMLLNIAGFFFLKQQCVLYS